MGYTGKITHMIFNHEEAYLFLYHFSVNFIDFVYLIQIMFLEYLYSVDVLTSNVNRSDVATAAQTQVEMQAQHSTDTRTG